MDAKALQRAAGVQADGIIGRGTLTAVFRKGGATLDRAQELAISANVHFRKYGILDTELRFAHFMAQLMHESGSFRYMEELASGAAYEGREDLGNSQPGDGVRYKGRGPIQLTGRANYRHFGNALGFDLERHPQLAAIPSIGLLAACEFWSQKGLNAFADKDDLLTITKRINGGTNGLADRRAKLAQVKGWFV